jgi:hypothetical protein
MSLLRHRNLVYLPFVLLFAATVVGGWANTTDMRGRIIDDYTDNGVVASITFGRRDAKSDTTGAFVFPNLPKTARVTIDSPGYFRKDVPTTDQDIRLQPNSITITVTEAGATPDKPIEKADVRQGDKVLGTTLTSGNTVISPHPGKDAQVLVCAEGHNRKTVTLKGVIMTVELEVGTEGCPPLPSPSPSAAPSASPAGSGSPAPSAAPSPSPTASP